MERKDLAWPDVRAAMWRAAWRYGPMVAVVLAALWRTQGAVSAHAVAAAATTAALLVLARGRVQLDDAMDIARFRSAPRWSHWEYSDEPLGEADDARYRHQLMGGVRARVIAFAADHGLDQISLGIPILLPNGDGYADASAVRLGRQGHVNFGYKWLGRAGTHLSVLLEHELEHIRRRHAATAPVLRATGTAAAVAAALTQPLTQAAVIGTLLALAGTARRWIIELACDRAALHRCGGDAVESLWRTELDTDREMPVLRRWVAALGAMRSHPPLRLRIHQATRWPAARVDRTSAPDHGAGQLPEQDTGSSGTGELVA